MSESDDVLIRLENVHRSFGGKRVLKGLDLSVRRGETYVIIGRSGTGKSVTLKHIVGLLKPHKGRVLVDGRNVPDMDVEELREFRKRFGYLFQSGALINWMTVGENVALPLLEHTKLEPRVIRVKVREALGMVGLEGVEGLAPSDLSGGMKKRVGLARAIISEPEILLYDEPTTGLDPVTTAIIDRQIDRLQEKLGVTSIVVSHDMASAFRVTGRYGRIGMLFEGRLIAEGTADEIRGTLDPVVRQFLEGSLDGPLDLEPKDLRAVEEFGSGVYRKGRWSGSRELKWVPPDPDAAKKESEGK
jgi:phospholipid/cholesterol/gamma-HCH transport system ATP-binding protein